MILTTDALLRTFGENKHTKFIYVFFSREVSNDEPRLWTQKTKDCFSDIWTCFSRFIIIIFYFLFFFFFDNFIFLWRDFIYFSTSNWITLKMSERLRQGGRFKRKGAHQVISYESREIEYYMSCLSQAEGVFMIKKNLLKCNVM